MLGRPRGVGGAGLRKAGVGSGAWAWRAVRGRERGQVLQGRRQQPWGAGGAGLTQEAGGYGEELRGKLGTESLMNATLP